MSCKILLISANQVKEPYPVYPLGISYLKTYLLKHIRGCIIDIFDLNLGGEEQLIDKIKGFRPKYIGISFRNVDIANSLVDRGFMHDYKDLVSTVRSETDAVIIGGGTGFSIFPSEIMEQTGLDYGVHGEGEAPFCELIQSLENGRAREIGAVMSRHGGCVCPRRESYLSSIEVEFEPQLVDYYWRQSGMLNIQTKRGCPYNCIYCSYPSIDGRVVRTMDVGCIVDNILKLKRDHGVDYLFFTDSVFNISNDYNRKLARALVDARAGISWGAYFSPFGLTDKDVELYKASGLTHVEFGTESFSDDCLVAYGKRFTFREVLEASELCLKHNVYYSHFLILGGYGETPETLAETIENSKRLRHTVFFPFVGMRIYPHTVLHKLTVDGGIIAKDDDLMEPRYHTVPWFNLEKTRSEALATGKAWIFPDDPQSEIMNVLRLKRHKKGPLWEYLRKP